jgi:hypothetical protein
MPSEFIDFNLTDRRIDIVNDLVGDLELRLDRIGVDPEPGGESIVITKGCTSKTCLGCSNGDRGGTCTCSCAGCLPGLGLEDLDIRGW